MADFLTLRYEPGPVTRVILNRPEKLNAQSWTLLTEMDQAFARAVEDSQCRVILLSGEGRAFSAGHDLTSDQQQADLASRAAHLEPFERGLLSREIYTDSHLRWRDLPKPTIAMVHGQCLFGGWMIAAAMDIIFASDDALFLASYGDYFTTAWDVGSRKAKELLFANAVLDAHEAERRGLVNRVYSADALERETLSFAERIAAQEPQRNRLIKFAINQSQDGMGFTQSVRAVGAAFIMRDYPSPSDAPRPDGAIGNTRPAGLDRDGRFKSLVADALDHWRSETARREESTR